MTSIRNFLLSFVIASILFGFLACGITNLADGTVGKLLDGGQSEENEVVSTEITNKVTEPDIVIDENQDLEGESFNILLVGTDYRPSLYSDYAPKISSQYPTFKSSQKLIGDGTNLPEYPYRTVSADAIVLVCVNEAKRTVAFVNIPSRMYIEYNGGNTFLGDLYYEKGFETFKTKVSALTGAEIDYYALTSVEQVANVVDKLGGVKFDVPCDMEYSDVLNGLSISLKAGETEIDGKMAADMLSYTSYVGKEHSRAKTTLSFVTALAKKATNPTNLANAASIFKNLEKYIYTNVTASDLTANLELIFSLNGFKFVEMEYPATAQGGGRYSPNVSAAISNISKYVAN